MFDQVAVKMMPPLDEMDPGPALVALLAAVEVSELSGYERVVVLRAHQRMASHFAAWVLEGMAAVSDSLHDLEDDPVVADESAAAEIRVALCLTRRAADSELSFALDLRRRLPQVWGLLAVGEIDQRRARVIIDGTSHLSPVVAREVVDGIIGVAVSLTTGQLAARLRRLCIDTDPDEARDRYHEAVAGRRVFAEATGEGTANLLGLDLPPDRVAAITRKVNRLAKGLRGGGECRSMDQLRADVFLDLLTGSRDHSTSEGGGVVDIHVDLSTLTELVDHWGELAGYGPVIADIARRVTQNQLDAEWRYTVTDPETGGVLTNGITPRRPTVTQTREVHAHYRTCVFPGCRMPAVDCDLDHRTLYPEGGPTHVSNLAPLCRHDHRIRHQSGWIHQPHPNGTHHWTTKLGHTYTTTRAPP